MAGWVVAALGVASLYTGVLVIACVAAGRWADDKFEELGAELRVIPDVAAEVVSRIGRPTGSNSVSVA
jgi:hypothetical protein